MAIRGIVWDVGNVLVKWNAADLYSQLISDPARAAWWVEHSFNHDWNLLGDKGMLYSDANPLWVAAFERDHADKISEYPRYRELIEAYGALSPEAHASLIRDSIALRNGLRPQYKTIALTNFSDENWVRVNDAHDGRLDQFDRVVMSARIGMLKTDVAIYRHLFDVANDEFGLAKEELVFIDDSAKNVAGAQDAGMKALLFVSPEKLRQDLAGLGIDTAHIPVENGVIKGARLGNLKPLM